MVPHEKYVTWHHAPSHRFVSGAAYIVTAGTFKRTAYFDTPAKRTFLQRSLFEEAERSNWRLEAWAIMSNHYHFVATAPEEAETLRRMIQALHSKTAIEINKRDEAPGRKVWYQYWDTCLTRRASYLARLNYVHHNPVKHGLVTHAEDYPWCSMGWFLNHADSGFRKTVLSMKHDRVNIRDDF